MIDTLDRDLRDHDAPLPQPSTERRSATDQSAQRWRASEPHQPLGHSPTTGMLLPVRIFLAAGWLRAGVEKLIDPAWWNGNTLRDFLDEQRHDALPFFRPIMDNAIAPAAMLVALTVMVTQFMCGVMIGTGWRMRLALRWAFFMNVTFILAGRVNPSAFYLVMELMVLFAIADGAISVAPSTPSRRTLTATAFSAALGVACIPYIRTIEPAKVIDDPAMMLSFIGLVTATTLLVRRAAHPGHEATRLGRLWDQRLAAWIHAQPRTTTSTFHDGPDNVAGGSTPCTPAHSEADTTRPMARQC